MDTLFKIGPLVIDFGMLISFFIGIGFGFIILLLIYLYAVIRGLNRKIKIHAAQEEDIDEEEIKWMIKDAQKQFKDKKMRKEEGYFKYLLDISKELSKDIATKFYPKSKQPFFELTIDETLMLMHYITDRIDEILDTRMLRLFRGYTINRLLELKNIKSSVDNNKVVKAGKKLKLGTIFSATMGALNVVNPVYWFRKIVINNALDVILNKLGLAAIAITGEETYKIYSKKVFNQDKILESSEDEVNDLYESLKKEFTSKETGDENAKK